MWLLEYTTVAAMKVFVLVCLILAFLGIFCMHTLCTGLSHIHFALHTLHGHVTVVPSIQNGDRSARIPGTVTESETDAESGDGQSVSGSGALPATAARPNIDADLVRSAARHWMEAAGVATHASRRGMEAGPFLRSSGRHTTDISMLSASAARRSMDPGKSGLLRNVAKLAVRAHAKASAVSADAA